jgi:hypothetical protein
MFRSVRRTKDEANIALDHTSVTLFNYGIYGFRLLSLVEVWLLSLVEVLGWYSILQFYFVVVIFFGN